MTANSVDSTAVSVLVFASMTPPFAYWRTLLLLRLHEFLSSFTSGYSGRKLQQKYFESTHRHTH